MQRWLVLLFLVLLPVSCLAQSNQNVEKVSIDFLYVNANAGEAAGGHTALRLGNTIYHFQFFPDATFLLVRDHWSSFYFLYNTLHNRTIFTASVPIDTTTFKAIKDHFTELLIEQQQQFNSLHKLRKQVAIRQAVEQGHASVSIAGLGFFSKATGQDAVSTSSLRQKIIANLGPNPFAQELEVGSRQTLLEAIAWQESIRILEQDYHLNHLNVIPPLPGEGAFNPSQQESLATFQHQQLRSILALLRSPRPDKGEALILQTARYLVVEQSIKAGKFYTLDPFPDHAKKIKLSTKETARSREFVTARLNQQTRQRATLFFEEKTHKEIAYSLLETSRARVAELLKAVDAPHEVRLLPEVRLPSHGKQVAITSPANLTTTRVTLSELQDRLQSLQAETSSHYNYNLIYKNCATELVRSLNTSFKDKESGQKELGGWVEPNGGLVFIPFLLYDKSTTSFPVQHEEVLTSRRLRQLEQLYANENDFMVWLRESNTLTSTLYEPRPRDTYFLFFTDDSWLLRPLQGILNLGYASLHGVAGIFTLPFDGGTRIHQAGRGMFYSLPEIAFCNIRKGSYATGEPSEKLNRTKP